MLVPLFLSLAVLLIPLPLAAAQPHDNGAVILAYQRVGEDIYPSNNISTEQFAANIQELIDGGYAVLPLPEIVAALKDGRTLPDRTVAITFDGTHRSALKNAFPVLLSNNLPFTVFFSPEQASEDSPQYIDWDDLQRLERNDQVTLGLHPGSYTRLSGLQEAEIRRQVNNAVSAFRKEIEAEPKFFAYPFGEYSRTYRDIVAASGFDAAFAQNSGAVYAGSDLYALPRFALTEDYADTERFRMAAQSMPLPVSDIAPENPYITGQNPPTFGFSIDPALDTDLKKLACFVSEQGKPVIDAINQNRVEMRFVRPLERGRVRINCTLPGPAAKPGEDQRWRWFGMLLTFHAGDEPALGEPGPGDETEPLPN